MTNYEKIKNMTVEEMAEFLEKLTDRCNANRCKNITMAHEYILNCCPNT